MEGALRDGFNTAFSKRLDHRACAATPGAPNHNWGHSSGLSQTTDQGEAVNITPSADLGSSLLDQSIRNSLLRSASGMAQSSPPRSGALRPNIGARLPFGSPEQSAAARLGNSSTGVTPMAASWSLDTPALAVRLRTSLPRQGHPQPSFDGGQNGIHMDSSGHPPPTPVRAPAWSAHSHSAASSHYASGGGGGLSAGHYGSEFEGIDANRAAARRRSGAGLARHNSLEDTRTLITLVDEPEGGGAGASEPEGGGGAPRIDDIGGMTSDGDGDEDDEGMMMQLLHDDKEAVEEGEGEGMMLLDRSAGSGGLGGGGGGVDQFGFSESDWADATMGNARRSSTGSTTAHNNRRTSTGSAVVTGARRRQSGGRASLGGGGAHNVTSATAGGGGGTEVTFERSFVIVRELGQGSFSKVFEVQLRSDPSQRYAVKRGLNKMRSRRDRREQLREVRVYRRLGEHPHLLRYTRAWQEEGFLYSQMELCPGGSLTAALNRLRAHEYAETLQQQQQQQVQYAATAATRAPSPPAPLSLGQPAITGAALPSGARVCSGGDGGRFTGMSIQVPPRPPSAMSDGSQSSGGGGGGGGNHLHSYGLGSELVTPKAGSHGLAGTLGLNPAEIPRYPLPEGTIWTFIGHVAAGLSHVHARGYVHLDVKPDNVLLAAGCCLKLGDLGLAAEVAPQGSGARRLSAGAGLLGGGGSVASGLRSGLTSLNTSFAASEEEAEQHQQQQQTQHAAGTPGWRGGQPASSPIGASPLSRMSPIPSASASAAARGRGTSDSMGGDGNGGGDDDSEGDSRYMAPELLQAGGRGPPADVFSLGVSAWELAYNADGPPTEGEPWHDLREGRIPPLPAELAPHRSPELLHMLSLLMAPHPAARPTAAQILTHPRVVAALAPGAPADPVLSKALAVSQSPERLGGFSVTVQQPGHMQRVAAMASGLASSYSAAGAAVSASALLQQQRQHQQQAQQQQPVSAPAPAAGLVAGSMARVGRSSSYTPDMVSQIDAALTGLGSPPLGPASAGGAISPRLSLPGAQQPPQPQQQARPQLEVYASSYSPALAGAPGRGATTAQAPLAAAAAAGGVGGGPQQLAQAAPSFTLLHLPSCAPPSGHHSYQLVPPLGRSAASAGGAWAGTAPPLSGRVLMHSGQPLESISEDALPDVSGISGVSGGLGIGGGLDAVTGSSGVFAPREAPTQRAVVSVPGGAPVKARSRDGMSAAAAVAARVASPSAGLSYPDYPAGTRATHATQSRVRGNSSSSSASAGSSSSLGGVDVRLRFESSSSLDAEIGAPQHGLDVDIGAAAATSARSLPRPEPSPPARPQPQYPAPAPAQAQLQLPVSASLFGAALQTPAVTHSAPRGIAGGVGIVGGGSLADALAAAAAPAAVPSNPRPAAGRVSAPGRASYAAAVSAILTQGDGQPTSTGKRNNPGDSMSSYVTFRGAPGAAGVGSGAAAAPAAGAGARVARALNFDADSSSDEEEDDCAMQPAGGLTGCSALDRSELSIGSASALDTSMSGPAGGGGAPGVSGGGASGFSAQAPFLFRPAMFNIPGFGAQQSQVPVAFEGMPGSSHQQASALGSSGVFSPLPLSQGSASSSASMTSPEADSAAAAHAALSSSTSAFGNPTGVSKKHPRDRDRALGTGAGGAGGSVSYARALGNGVRRTVRPVGSSVASAAAAPAAASSAFNGGDALPVAGGTPPRPTAQAAQAQGAVDHLSTPSRTTRSAARAAAVSASPLKQSSRFLGGGGLEGMGSVLENVPDATPARIARARTRRQAAMLLAAGEAEAAGRAESASDGSSSDAAQQLSRSRLLMAPSKASARSSGSASSGSARRLGGGGGSSGNLAGAGSAGALETAYLGAGGSQEAPGSLLRGEDEDLMSIIRGRSAIEDEDDGPGSPGIVPRVKREKVGGSPVHGAGPGSRVGASASAQVFQSLSYAAVAAGLGGAGAPSAVVARPESATSLSMMSDHDMDASSPHAKRANTGPSPTHTAWRQAYLARSQVQGVPGAAGAGTQLQPGAGADHPFSVGFAAFQRMPSGFEADS